MNIVLFTLIVAGAPTVAPFEVLDEKTVDSWRSLKTTNRIEFTKKFFNYLNPATMNLVDDFYHPDSILLDPIGRQVGRKEVKDYYASIYGPVTSIVFEFGETIEQGDRMSLPWTMHFKSKKLKRNKLISVEGISMIRFDKETGQAIHHQDYYDVGAMVHEHIPVIGGLFRWVKKKLDH